MLRELLRSFFRYLAPAKQGQQEIGVEGSTSSGTLEPLSASIFIFGLAYLPHLKIPLHSTKRSRNTSNPFTRLSRGAVYFSTVDEAAVAVIVTSDVAVRRNITRALERTLTPINYEAFSAVVR